MQGERQERDVFRAAFARRSLPTDCYAICNTVLAGFSRKVTISLGIRRNWPGFLDWSVIRLLLSGRSPLPLEWKLLLLTLVI